MLLVRTVFAGMAALGFAVPLSLPRATQRTEQLVLGRERDADYFATLVNSTMTQYSRDERAAEVGLLESRPRDAITDQVTIEHTDHVGYKVN
jgi:hypothetical protein